MLLNDAVLLCLLAAALRWGPFSSGALALAAPLRVGDSSLLLPVIDSYGASPDVNSNVSTGRTPDVEQRLAGHISKRSPMVTLTGPLRQAGSSEGSAGNALQTPWKSSRVSFKLDSQARKEVEAMQVMEEPQKSGATKMSASTTAAQDTVELGGRTFGSKQIETALSEANKMVFKRYQTQETPERLGFFVNVLLCHKLGFKATSAEAIQVLREFKIKPT